jgi:predicted nuclease with RNAse H fold
MVYRAMALRRSLEARGIPVIEVYPYASKVRFWGKGMPKKTTPAGRRCLRGELEGLIPNLEHEGRLGHDQLDAIVAAYTAYLYGRGLAEGVGDRDEGLIWLPRAVSLR